MWKFAAAIAVIGGASGAAAETFDEIYVEGKEAAERCENSWFAKRREQALDDLMDIGFRLLASMSPLDPTYEVKSMMYDQIFDAQKRCACVVLPDSFICPDDKPTE